MASVYYHIRSAMRKIDKASYKGKGCTLSKEEVRAITLSHEISEALGDYDYWKFDENKELVEKW